MVGLAGVGKSVVARDAMHYVLERRYFGGGVIQIDLAQIRSYKIFEGKMKNFVIKSLDLTPEDSIHHKIKKAREWEFLELLEEFFDQRTERFKLRNKVSNHDFSLKFLLCLDNAQDLIRQKFDG